MQICLRLSGTYRFPLPPIAVELLSYIKFLEFLDIAQVPMNLDCWRSYSYVDKVYIHTLTCLAVMILIKPEQLGILLPLMRAPVKLVLACGAWSRQKLGLSVGNCAKPEFMVAMFTSARGLGQHMSKVIVRGAKQQVKSTSELLRMIPSAPSHPKANPTKTGTPPSHATLDRTAAAIVLQRLWRHRNPAVLAAHRNIATLRQNLLSFVGTAKHLGREDILLLFSYAVYSSLQDTCFMYFDYRFVLHGYTALLIDAFVSFRLLPQYLRRRRDLPSR